MNEIKKLEQEEKQYINNLEEKKKNTWTPNDILIYSDCAKVILRNVKQEINGVCTIDNEDVDLIKKYKWSNCSGYARTSTDGKTTKMHRMLMKPPKDKVIDHINHNTLDNRKKNLRIVTNTVNLKHILRQKERIFHVE